MFLENFLKSGAAGDKWLAGVLPVLYITQGKQANNQADPQNNRQIGRYMER